MKSKEFPGREQLEGSALDMSDGHGKYKRLSGVDGLVRNGKLGEWQGLRAASCQGADPVWFDFDANARS